MAGLEVASDVDLDGVHGLGPELETTIYRLLQEALTNVVKHAGATTARVAVRAAEDCVVVDVHDNGAGFDASARTSGVGLAGMRERVYLAGGRLEIQSGAEGTTVEARLPIGGSRADLLT